MGVVVAKSTVVRSEAAAQLQHLGSKRGRGGGLGPVIDDYSLFATIMAEVNLLRVQDNLVVLDARMFSDPDGRRGGARQDHWHVGLHADKVRDVVRSEVFPGWVADARQKLECGWRTLQPGGRLGVVVYCRKGAHRSVACATILHHCLQQRFPGAHVFPMHHFSKAHLWRRDYCGECQACVDSADSIDMSGAELQTLRFIVRSIARSAHGPTHHPPIHLAAHPSLPDRAGRPTVRRTLRVWGTATSTNAIDRPPTDRPTGDTEDPGPPAGALQLGCPMSRRPARPGWWQCPALAVICRRADRDLLLWRLQNISRTARASTHAHRQARTDACMNTHICMHACMHARTHASHACTHARTHLIPSEPILPHLPAQPNPSRRTAPQRSAPHAK